MGVFEIKCKGTDCPLKGVCNRFDDKSIHLLRIEGPQTWCLNFSSIELKVNIIGSDMKVYQGKKRFNIDTMRFEKIWEKLTK